MKSIKQHYFIKAPTEKVWEALTNPLVIEKWGGGPAKMEDTKGFEFSLWGGDIYGVNKKIIPGKMIVQEWFGGDWEKPSTVKFILRGGKGSTRLSLVHEGVPGKELKDIEEGWKSYYIGPLKKLLENA